VVLRRLLLTLACLSAVVAGAQPVLAAVDARSSSLGDAPFVHGRPAATDHVAVRLSAASIGSVETSTLALPEGSFSLRGAFEGSKLLADRLQLEVVAGAKTVYAGPLAGFRGARLDGARKVALRLSLPSTGSDAGDNALQGLAASAVFNVG
jgi:hypothetical protein